MKSATRSNTSPLLLVISAPSGGGKTTLCQMLLAARPGMVRAVTCTTRPPRDGESEGVDYYFLSAEAFLTRVQAGDFLEHATVHGHRYGTLKSEVLDKLREGRDVLLNVDVQGAAAIRAQTGSYAEMKRAMITVFLTPASMSVLEARLNRRASDSPAVIQQRLAAARQEIARWRNFDYLVVSTSKEEDFRLAQAIIEAEKLRASRAQPPEF